VVVNSSADPSELAPTSRDWRRRLPVLRDDAVTLRALRPDDAPSLIEHLNQPRVLEHIAPCPSTVVGFRRFIRWTHAERRRRGLACFGIVPSGQRHAVGVMQVWPIERDFSTAEWGFALGESYWGTGLFMRAARLFVDAVFADLGVHRLEARAVDVNQRGHCAFEKLGAKRDGVLRGGFCDGATVRDQIMWSILAPEWQMLRRESRRAH
jgi:RimJ/RimL family protein N-acetyltransferase